MSVEIINPSNITQADLDDMHNTLKIDSFPKNVIFETTTGCNFKCSMCHNKDMTRKKTNIKADVWDTGLQQMKELGVTSTNIWLTFYGEAMLLFKKLLYGLTQTTEMGFENTFLNTNGSLMKDNRFELLAKAGLKHMVFSVDGFSKEIYESIRIGGKRDEVYKNVIQSIETNEKMGRPVDIEIQMIEMPDNSDEKEKFIEYWNQYGVAVKLKKMLTWTDDENDFSRFILSNFDRIGCPWAFGTFVILANGDVNTCGCDFDGRHIYGNIFETNIKDIWESRHEHLRAHQNKDFDQLPSVCSKCTDWFVAVSDKVKT